MIGRAGLAVAKNLVRFIEQEALPGTGIQASVFWQGVAEIYACFAEENAGLLNVRSRLQAKIDVPWFWSNQYDLRLQTIGLSRGYDDLVVRGDPDSRSFSIIHLRGHRVIALDCVNAACDYSHGRLLVAGGVTPDRALLADANVQLKVLAAAKTV